MVPSSVLCKKKMSVTIKDCFNLPSLSGGSVIAGKKGLDNIVTSISVLEYDDGYISGEINSNSILSQNELLISSFYTIKDDIEAQCQSVRYFKNTGNVGLVLLYTGTVLKTIPEELIATADEISFPILIFPDNHPLIRFSDIISDVMESVFAEKKREDNLIKNIMKIISEFPKKSQNLDTLLQLISNNKKISIFLSDENHMLISNGLWPLHTTLNYQFLSGYLTQLDKNEKITITDDSTPIEIYSLPILIDKTKFNLMVIDQNSNFNKPSLLEIEELLSLFASVYHYDTFFHAKNTLIEALLRQDTYLVNKIGATSTPKVSALDSLLVVKTKTYSSSSLFDISEKLNEFPLFHAINKGQLIILGSSTVFSNECKVLFSEILNNNNFLMYTSTIGSYRNFSSYYNEIQIAIPYLEKIYKRKTDFSAEDISFALKIHKIIEDGHDEVERYLDITKSLLNENTDDLVETISTYYFDAFSEVNATSQILYVHRNTIQYRFQKAKRVLGYDFTTLPYLFNIYLSCALRRYFS